MPLTAAARAMVKEKGVTLPHRFEVSQMMNTSQYSRYWVWHICLVHACKTEGRNEACVKSGKNHTHDAILRGQRWWGPCQGSAHQGGICRTHCNPSLINAIAYVIFFKIIRSMLRLRSFGLLANARWRRTAALAARPVHQRRAGAQRRRWGLEAQNSPKQARHRNPRLSWQTGQITRQSCLGDIFCLVM